MQEVLRRPSERLRNAAAYALLSGEASGARAMPLNRPCSSLPLATFPSGLSDSSKQTVLEWMLTAEEDQVKWVLQQLVRERPGLAHQLDISPAVEDMSKRTRTMLRHAASTNLTEGVEALLCADEKNDDTTPAPPKKKNLPALKAFAGTASSGVAMGRILSTFSKAQLVADEDADEGKPLVHFLASFVYAQEDQDHLSLEVLRTGDCSQRSELWVSTKDGSAKAGVKYVKMNEKVVFEPHEKEKIISVSLIDDDIMDSTLEFQVILQKEGLVNAALTRYLSRASVRIYDNDEFPTNRYRHIAEQAMHEATQSQLAQDPTRKTPPSKMTLKLSKFSLLWEYYRFNYRHSQIRERTNSLVLIGFIKNCFKVIELLISVYLVDSVLKPAIKEHIFTRLTEFEIMMVAISMVVPVGLSHVMDYKRAVWGRIGGPSRRRLQTGMLRRFLHWSRASRAQEREADLVMGITRDTLRVVTDGYWSLIHMLEEAGSLVAIVAYQMLAPVLFHRSFSWLAYTPCLYIPLLMIMWVRCRQDMSSELLADRDAAQNGLADAVCQTVDNHRIIDVYNTADKVVEDFEGKVDKYNKARTKTVIMNINNVYFAKWLSHISVAIWVFYGGLHVVHGSMSLGIFLVNMRVFRTLGNSWFNIYRLILTMQKCLPILMRVTVLMNMSTDVQTRGEFSEVQRQCTRSLRSTMGHAELGEGNITLQKMPIVISNFTFIHKTVNEHGDVKRMTKLLFNNRVHIHQGQLVCLTGPKGGGKSTLLRLLAGAVLPQIQSLTSDGPAGNGLQDGRGVFFIPSHLRILHVAEDPLFVSGNLIDNLVYGVTSGQDEIKGDGNMERVQKICNRLLIGTDVVDLLTDPDVIKWEEVLSRTQVKMISLARAFISNADVMCIHHPCALFGKEHSDAVVQMMLEYVRHRGVEVGDESARERRMPHTCIIATTDDRPLSVADLTYHVSPNGIYDITEMREAGMHFTPPLADRIPIARPV